PGIAPPHTNVRGNPVPTKKGISHETHRHRNGCCARRRLRGAAGQHQASVRGARRHDANRYARCRQPDARGESVSVQLAVRQLTGRCRRMPMLPIALRLSLRLLRASLHAAVVFTASVALLLLFLLWSVLQLLDESETASLSRSREATRAMARFDLAA